MLSMHSYGQSDKPMARQGIEIPPSPEVAELGRASLSSTELFTGASKVEIPIYHLKAGDIELPLQLRYSNNGIRVSDIPSRVGLGWSMQFSGAVSRVVRDEPDDESTFLTAPDFNYLNRAELDYLELAGQYGYDTEHDIFSFAAGDISGQFFIDTNKIPHLISHSNAKIEPVYSGGKILSFVITNGRGVKYYFGEADMIEKTREVNLNPSQGPKQKICTTAWFLTKIISPEGDGIYFEYGTLNTDNLLGPQQSVDLEPNNGSGGDPLNDYCNFCKGILGGVFYPHIYYSTRYVTRITTSRGAKIDFGYEQRPDNSGDNRLLSLKIWSGVQSIKEYRFVYNVPFVPANQITNSKYYLDTLKVLPVSPSTIPSQDYTFSYISPTSIKDIVYKGVDYYGYDNGVSSNVNLYPRFIGDAAYINGTMGANRLPNLNFATIGALKKVVYPTGGYQEFFYEMHDLNTIESQTTKQSIDVATDGLSIMTAKSASATFTPTQNQTVELNYRVEMSPGAPPEGDPEYWPAQDLQNRVAMLEFFEGSTRIYKKDVWAYGDLIYTPTIQAGKTYQVKVTAYGRTNSIMATLYYDPTTSDINVNKPACGIRVSRIQSFDPETGAAEDRYFNYRSLLDDNKSSGVGSIGVPIMSGGLRGGWCVPPSGQGGPVLGEALTICNDILSVQSTSLPLPAAFNGSPIAYRYVVESKDAAFSSGIEHEFVASFDIYPLAPVLNKSIQFGTSRLQTDLNGREVRSLTFRKDEAGSIKKVNEQFNRYKVLDQGTSIDNYLIRKKWERPAVIDSTVVAMAMVLSGWDVNVYSYDGGWAVLDSQENYVYDLNGNNPVRSVMNYKYLNPVHAEPTERTLLSSNGKVYTTKYYYPTDFSGLVYQNMKNQHIVSKVVKSTVETGGTMIFTQNLAYKDWFGNGKVYRPEIYTVQKGNLPVQTDFENITVDQWGNITSQRVGTQLRSYLWGYNGQYPVLEIKNATYAEVATALTQVAIDNLNSSNQTEATMETLIKNASDKLRTNLPGAMVTSYTYKPLVGMTSKTDARGVTEYYKYDGMQRLQAILDHLNYVNKSFDYHYRPN
ncbi:hypothetical protein [Sphingobacterium sp.]|uniref:hypothetical protein n=1 Tax=Sphingobacterium sp. TaxID=341027 RepID=UPI002FD9B659